jgi:hypothetical protein
MSLSFCWIRSLIAFIRVAASLVTRGEYSQTSSLAVLRSDEIPNFIEVGGDALPGNPTTELDHCICRIRAKIVTRIKGRRDR